MIIFWSVVCAGWIDFSQIEKIRNVVYEPFVKSHDLGLSFSMAKSYTHKSEFYIIWNGHCHSKLKRFSQKIS